MSRYRDVYATWKKDPEAFWAEAARDIDWINLWDKVFDPYAGEYGRIGFQVFLFKHDDLASKGTIAFSRRWKNEGDWEIFGNVTATLPPPLNALTPVFRTATVYTSVAVPPLLSATGSAASVTVTSRSTT